MHLSRRTIAISSAVAAAAVAAGGAVSAATTSTPPQLSTITYVGVYDTTFAGFPGDTHRVSVLMKRGNTSTFGKNQQNFVNVESFSCTGGAVVPSAGPVPAACTLVATTPMRNTDATTAWVSSTGRSGSFTGRLTSRSGTSRSLSSTLKFFYTTPGGEHSFGPDMNVRNGSGRVTGLLGGKAPTSASVLVTTFGA
jgi:hypothetical protein